MYREGQKRLNQSPRMKSWFWGGITGLVLVSVVVVSVFVMNQNKPRADESPSPVGEHKPSAVVPSLPNPVSEPLVHTVQEEIPLPALDFPPGSVEEACGLNEFPTFWVGEGLKRHYGHNIEVLESNGACRAALEAYMSSVNPYLWGESEASFQVVDTFAFVVLDEPLTFGRIFADPIGDFNRVQDALLRPECLLQGDETNWELQETCHADAFLNYALLNRFCFDEGIHYRDTTIIYPEDNPTPEQDRFMWKQSLEDDWVRMKCKELGPTLELTSEQNPVLYELVMSLAPSDRKKDSRELLIELAARLGDNAAGITEGFVASFGKHSYNENGKKYERLSWLLKSDQWWEFASKEPPSVDRFIQVFRMLALLVPGDPIPAMNFSLIGSWWLSIFAHGLSILAIASRLMRRKSAT